MKRYRLLVTVILAMALAAVPSCQKYDQIEQNLQSPIVKVMHFDAENVIMNGSGVAGTVQGPDAEYPDET